MSRLVIISNRLPITIDHSNEGLNYYPSAGGLATGLISLDDSIEKIWIGWPGHFIEPSQQEQIKKGLAQQDLIPVFLTQEQIATYYEGFCNKTIWPHFHYFSQFTRYIDENWQAYQEVNQLFSKIVCKELREDDIVWVHDYHLMLLPNLIRQNFPGISIGFFLHIPFPSYELFRVLPWREEILKGLLGADQIGFHTYDYMRHFLSATYRISGYEHSFGKMTVGNRTVNVDVFPMGIDYEKYAFPERLVGEEEIQSRVARYKSKGRKLVISIDRLDYTKGISKRLRAYEKFLSDHSQYHGKVTLIMIVVPSRSNVSQYKALKTEVDKLVGRIDGNFRTFGWSPIQYYYRSFSFTDLSALYKAADIALITPLRDGMNLVAKEFVASKEENKRGVLILSEMAGAADELTDALIINPQDEDEMIEVLLQALEMPEEEQQERLEKMQELLKKNTVSDWAQTFLSEQAETVLDKLAYQANLLNEDGFQQMKKDFQQAQRKLILLDYDGTLVNFKADPMEAFPDKKILKTLQRLKEVPGTTLVIISGRDRNTMDVWLGDLELEMSAEHGVWRKNGNNWSTDQGLSNQWKSKILPVLEKMVERTPGSFVEEKEFSLVWHYRKIDKALGEKRIREFRDVLQYLTGNLDLQVLEGKKVVEIKNAGINKGKSALHWLNKGNWDFVLALGDDNTDEDIFEILPPEAYSIKVGLGQTAARFNLLSVEKSRELLDKMC